jgi:hypothetical protein
VKTRDSKGGERSKVEWSGVEWSGVERERERERERKRKGEREFLRNKTWKLVWDMG